MDTNKRDRLQSLRMSASRLRQAFDDLWVEIEHLAEDVAGKDGVQVDPTPSKRTARVVESKLAERVCLFCDRQMDDEEKVVRGVCSGCYHRLYRKIRDGRASLPELIEQGKIAADVSKGGRPEGNRFERQEAEARIEATVEEMKEKGRRENLGVGGTKKAPSNRGTKPRGRRH